MDLFNTFVNFKLSKKFFEIFYQTIKTYKEDIKII